MSDVCRVAYIGPMSRTERPRKTKIGTEIGRVTCDLETTFKVKRLKDNLHGSEAYCGGPAQLVIIIMLPTLIGGGIKRCFCLMSVCLTSV